MKAFCTLQVSSACKYLSWMTIAHGLSMHFIFKNETYETYTNNIYTYASWFLELFRSTCCKMFCYSCSGASGGLRMLLWHRNSCDESTSISRRPHNVMIMRIVPKDAPCVRHVGKTEMKRTQSDAIRKKDFCWTSAMDHLGRASQNHSLQKWKRANQHPLH